jgi:hypothetical protein
MTERDRSRERHPEDLTEPRPLGDAEHKFARRALYHAFEDLSKHENALEMTDDAGGVSKQRSPAREEGGRLR